MKCSELKLSPAQKWAKENCNTPHSFIKRHTWCVVSHLNSSFIFLYFNICYKMLNNPTSKSWNYITHSQYFIAIHEYLRFYQIKYLHFRNSIWGGGFKSIIQENHQDWVHFRDKSILLNNLQKTSLFILFQVFFLFLLALLR